jgi:hypothetical protein
MNGPYSKDTDVQTYTSWSIKNQVHIWNESANGANTHLFVYKTDKSKSVYDMYSEKRLIHLKNGDA